MIHLRWMLLFFFSAGSLLAQQLGFTERAAEAGVQSPGGNYGVAFGDFDNDGWEDIYISRYIGADRLYRNNHDGTFTDVAPTAGVAVAAHSQSAVWGDFDNDGWLDLYVATAAGDTNRLFHNRGDGTFEDVTIASGTGSLARTQAAIWADVDNDGRLDLYLANFLPDPNQLFRNNGDGTFTEVALQWNAAENTFAMAAVPGDYDNDGDTDFYLTHDANIPYTLLRNEGGRFASVGPAAGVNFAGMGMGADFGDIDNDGWMDLYVTNLKGNVLYRNRGDGTFEDITAAAGVGDRGMAWSTFFADFDNDGWLDLYVVKQSSYSTPALPNVLYHNRGNGTFGTMLQYDAVSSMGSGIGGACADVNNDGAVDFLVANSPDRGIEGNQLFINNGPMHGWLKVKLRGVISNRCGIGARIVLWTGAMRQMRFVAGGSGFASQNSLVQTFGLGAAPRADSVVVYWPSGKIDRFGPLAAGQTVTLVEASGAITGVKTTAGRSPRSFRLSAGFPNPLRGEGGPVTWRLSAAGNRRPAAVVYNFLGQVVARPEIVPAADGEYFLRWNGRLGDGRPAPQGLYFLQVSEAGEKAVRKIAVFR